VTNQFSIFLILCRQPRIFFLFANTVIFFFLKLLLIESRHGLSPSRSHRTVLDSLPSHGSYYTNQYVSLFSLCKSVSPLVKQVGELLLHSVHPAIGFVQRVLYRLYRFRAYHTILLS